MKIETEFGIGEIVCIMDANSHNNNIPDLLGQVVSIQLDREATGYVVEIPSNNVHVQRVVYYAWQLTGDPDYDQELGRYPEEED